MQNTEEWIVEQGGAVMLLHYKTRIAIRQMEDEIERLRRLEAEAESQAGASAAQLATLATHHTTLQAEMLLLADGLEGEPIFDRAVGRTLTESELRARAQEKLEEFSHLQAQQQKYAQANTLQQQTAQRAQQMQREAAQSIASLHAHLALIEAQELWQNSGGGEKLSAPELQAELVYAERLAAERQALAGELSPLESIAAGPPTLPDGPRSPYADLVAALRAQGGAE